MNRQVLTPGPDHPITVEPGKSRVVARVGDTIVADTTSSLVLRESTYPPVHYIPLQDVNPDLLLASDSQTYCPYKGDASYYHLTVDGRQLTDAVWTYRTPNDPVREIAGHVAFYPDQVSVTEE